MTEVNPEEIIRAGRRIAIDGDEWLAELPAIGSIGISGFGDDAIGRLIAAFHGQVHAPTMEYLHEVGECAGDVGVGLVRVGELYADTERDNVWLAAGIAREVANIGVF